jgi:hypothetical protein
MPSRTADAIIRKAELCYSLDLITKGTLENVVRRAETEPGYTAILELPFDWHIEDELRLRRQARRQQRRSRLIGRVRRLVLR